MCLYLLRTERLRLDVCQALQHEFSSISDSNFICLLRHYDPLSSRQLQEMIADLIEECRVSPSQIYTTHTQQVR